MNSRDLQNLLSAGTAGASADSALAGYVESFFPALFAAYERHQERIDFEFPEYWEGTVHSEEHLVQMFDRMERFSLTKDALNIRTWECFRGEYDHKDVSFPRAIFDETDPLRREALIETHFTSLADAKRAEYRAKKEAEKACRRQQYEVLKQEFEPAASPIS